MPSNVPQKSAIRSNPARPDWVVLPYNGRTGAPPAWPLEDKPAGVVERWRELWKLPQATEWQKLHLERVVARYVLTLLSSERIRSATWNAAMLGESRQLEDRLGLSAMAMKRLQWEMGPNPADGPKAPGAGKGVSQIDDYRDL